MISLCGICHFIFLAFLRSMFYFIFSWSMFWIYLVLSAHYKLSYVERFVVDLNE